MNETCAKRAWNYSCRRRECRGECVVLVAVKIFEEWEEKIGIKGGRELDRLSTSPLLHAAKIFPFREIK